MVLLRSSCCPVPWNWPCGLRWRGIVDDWVMIAGLVVGCRLLLVVCCCWLFVMFVLLVILLFDCLFVCVVCCFFGCGS